MIELAEFLHYTTIALIVGVNSVSVGIGEGLTGVAALEAMHKQPAAQNEIVRIALIGMALIETSAILAVVLALFLFIGAPDQGISLYQAIAHVGIGFALCLAGSVVGIGASWPARKACHAVARQPFFGQKIMRIMLITQSIIQSPMIFAFIIALFINGYASSVTTLADSIKLLASGLCIGLGSIGPGIGLSLFAQAACEGIGINRRSFEKIQYFTFISEAIIETPIIFALLVALLLVATPSIGDNMLKGVAFLSAAIAMGLGTFAPGIASGKTAAAACRQIALHPNTHAAVSRTSMLAQGLIDTCAIYALVIALLLFFAG